ncbi:MAG TPA: hypothetical protein VIC28_05020 [Thermoanaerobaculia bacterium]|jgi:hypothetical protein
MRDDRGDEDAEELPPDDPVAELERLDDGFEDPGPADEHPPSAPPLSRREIDELVNQTITEALSLLGGEKDKP